MKSQRFLIGACVVLFASQTSAKTSVFTGGAITVNDNTDANPYPSTITVAGINNPSSVISLNVKLNGLSHTNPDDLDIFLMNPAGAVVALMSDAGGSEAITNIDLTFNNVGPMILQDESNIGDPITSGSYMPADYEPGETPPLGAAGPATTDFNQLMADAYNGEWKLFVTDDSVGGTGSITSWGLEVQYLDGTFTTLPAHQTGLSDQQSVLLPDGRVFVIGGGSNTTQATCRAFDPHANLWSESSPMSIARSWHSAVVLRDGRVLVAGGRDGEGMATDSCEIYNPASDSWAATGSLSRARYRQTMTVMPDGKVIAIGGWDATDIPTELVEIYDPSNGTWSNAATLNFGRTDHATTLLSNGKLLVSGGHDQTSLVTTSSCELYDPAANTWTPTGSLTEARQWHAATLLADGRVLVTGGRDEFENDLSSAEIYDPGTGLWSNLNSLIGGRHDHSTTLLPDGRVMIIGGSSIGASLNSCEIYDPGTASWSIGPALITAQSNHNAVLLPGGKVMIIGEGAEMFIPNYDQAWTATDGLAIPTEGHTATILYDGRVLAACGSINGTTTSTCQIYTPDTLTWATTGSPSIGRTAHQAVLLKDGGVLIVGGINASGDAIDSCEIYDPDTGTWSPATSMSVERSHARAVLLSSGKVLVAGGADLAGAALASCEIYDPETDTWASTGSLTGARERHSLTILADGTVLTVGGAISGSSIASAERFDPWTGTWTSAAIILEARQDHTATLLSDGRVLIAGGADPSLMDGITACEIYDPTGGLWQPTGQLSQARSSHQATLLRDGRVLLSGGEFDGTIQSSSQTFDPTTETWTEAGNMSTERVRHSATLLLDGSVLVAGGRNLSATTGTSERFAVDLGNNPAWQPTITTATHQTDGSLELAGTLFTGIASASGGNHQESASNHVVVQVRELPGGQTHHLLYNASDALTAIHVSTAALPPFQGLAIVTAFVNGIPSDSVITSFTPSASQDYDGDTVSDAEEFRLIDLGFNPKASQPELVALLNTGIDAGKLDITSNAPDYSLYSESDMQALRPGATFLRRSGSNPFVISLSMEKSSDLSSFSKFRIDGAGMSTTIGTDGRLHFKFPTSDPSAFFRSTARDENP